MEHEILPQQALEVLKMAYEILLMPRRMRGLMWKQTSGPLLEVHLPSLLLEEESLLELA
jgi:hypothetical protein